MKLFYFIGKCSRKCMCYQPVSGRQIGIAAESRRFGKTYLSGRTSDKEVKHVSITRKKDKING
jgi:hypothetical protein